MSKQVSVHQNGRRCVIGAEPICQITHLEIISSPKTEQTILPSDILEGERVFAYSMTTVVKALLLANVFEESVWLQLSVDKLWFREVFFQCQLRLWSMNVKQGKSVETQLALSDEALEAGMLSIC